MWHRVIATTQQPLLSSVSFPLNSPQSPLGMSKTSPSDQMKASQCGQPNHVTEATKAVAAMSTNGYSIGKPAIAATEAATHGAAISDEPEITEPPEEPQRPLLSEM